MDAVLLTAQPFLAPGQGLTAALSLQVLALLRKHPGQEILLRRSRYSVTSAMRRLLHPYVLWRQDGEDVYVRLRLVGEPLPSLTTPARDLTGAWIYLGEAAEVLGLSRASQVKDLYVRSGILPVHRYGHRPMVRRADVERVAGLRAGGAVIADMPAGAGWLHDETPEATSTVALIEAREAVDG